MSKGRIDEMIVHWPELDGVLASGQNILLFGPPGTGKTRIATSSSSYSITLTEETPAAELRGHYIPDGTRFKWHDGPGMRAWREGARVVLNEIDKASGDALVFLHALLDDPEVARLTLPTGETVRPAPGFQAIATMNGTPDDLSPALLDRLSVRVHITEPHPAALAKLAPELANAVLATIGQSNERAITLRQAFAFTALVATLKDDSLAARSVWGDRAPDVLNSIKLASAKAR